MHAIYPGTFDPITIGHIDIIKRSLNIFDNMVIAIAENHEKNPLFSQEKREELVKLSLQDAGIYDERRIQIKSFSGLLVDFAKQENSKIMIRGLRAVSDFEYEFQMACMNSKLASDIETIFLPSSENTHFISSRFVKQISKLNGDISGLVTKSVSEYLNKL
ncbi:MAG: pantetheine-phosphate adenylyltransferase [Rickettsiales bacterium]|jgi:pantetheine-phosphate adenylyltransferase|nr:pantetheine-phosphate adenylyltransferase [Rickettsiales bacterium]